MPRCRFYRYQIPHGWAGRTRFHGILPVASAGNARHELSTVTSSSKLLQNLSARRTSRALTIPLQSPFQLEWAATRVVKLGVMSIHFGSNCCILSDDVLARFMPQSSTFRQAAAAKCCCCFREAWWVRIPSLAGDLRSNPARGPLCKTGEWNGTTRHPTIIADAKVLFLLCTAVLVHALAWMLITCRRFEAAVKHLWSQVLYAGKQAGQVQDMWLIASLARDSGLAKDVRHR